jgi:hypothetical protein
MATVPTVQVWSTGQYVTAAQMNAGVGNVLSWLMGTPRAIIYRNAAVSWASNGIPSVISWTTELVDTDTMWSSGHPSRFTFNTAGLWQIELAVHYNEITTGASHCGIGLNSAGTWPSFGSTNRLQESTLSACGTAFGQSMNLTFSYYFNQNDYIEAFTTQNSGSAVSAFPSGTYFDGHLSAKWLASS